MWPGPQKCETSIRVRTDPRTANEQHFECELARKGKAHQRQRQSNKFHLSVRKKIPVVESHANRKA